jgi:hypothetical protein
MAHLSIAQAQALVTRSLVATGANAVMAQSTATI